MTNDQRLRSRPAWALLAAVFALSACSEGESSDAPEGDTLTDEAPVTATLPAGTIMTFEVDEAISTSTHAAGDRFTATLMGSAAASDGSVGVPAGTLSRWVVTESTTDGPEGQALLAFRLESIQSDGEWIPIDATVTATDVVTEERDSNTETAAKVAVGAAAGAIIGQILGRDSESTLTGAGVGAAVGTVVALTTRSGSAGMQAGSTVTVQLDEPVELES